MLMDTESCCRIFSSFKVMILILKLKKKSPRKMSDKLNAFHQSWEQLKLRESQKLDTAPEGNKPSTC